MANDVLAAQSSSGTASQSESENDSLAKDNHDHGSKIVDTTYRAEEVHPLTCPQCGSDELINERVYQVEETINNDEIKNQNDEGDQMSSDVKRPMRQYIFHQEEIINSSVLTSLRWSVHHVNGFGWDTNDNPSCCMGFMLKDEKTGYLFDACIDLIDLDDAPNKNETFEYMILQNLDIAFRLDTNQVFDADGDLLSEEEVEAVLKELENNAVA